MKAINLDVGPIFIVLVGDEVKPRDRDRFWNQLFGTSGMFDSQEFIAVEVEDVKLR